MITKKVFIFNNNCNNNKLFLKNKKYNIDHETKEIAPFLHLAYVKTPQTDKEIQYYE